MATTATKEKQRASTLAESVMTAAKFEVRPVYTIYLPGGCLSLDEQDGLEAELCQIFGGFTRNLGKGGYQPKGADKPEIDGVWTYTVICSEEMDTEMAAIAAKIKELGQQDTVLITKEQKGVALV